MATELKLKTNAKPSFLNKEMQMGLLIGALLPITIAGMPLTSILGLAAAGAIIGGAVGKNRMETEAREGKRIGTPTSWNKDAVIGGLSGYIWGGVTGLVAAFVIAEVSPAFVAFETAIAIGGALGAVVGAIRGGNRGKAQMEAEYKLAVAQQLVQTRSRAPELAQEMNVANGKGFAERLDIERMIAQEHAR